MTFEVELSEAAKADLRLVPMFRRRPIFVALERLRQEAVIETLHRKPLAQPLDELPDANWELRIGDYRAFYAVGEEQNVTVLRVIFKGSTTTPDALGRGRRR